MLSATTAIAAAAAVVSPAAVEGAAAVGREVHGRGRLDDICGSRALRAGPTQDIRLVRVHRGHERCVLCGLRRRKPQGLILALKRADLILAQVVQNSPAVRVCVVDDVPGVVVHGVLEGAGVGRQVVVHAVDCSLGFAAIMLS